MQLIFLFVPKSEDERPEIDEDRHGDADLSIDDHDEGQISTAAYTTDETTSSDSSWPQQESRKVT